MRPFLSRRRLLMAGLSAPLAGAAALALGGCVVTPYGPYYRPVSGDPRARLRGAWCSGAAGPVTAIELPLADGVTLSTDASTAARGGSAAGPRVQVGLTLPGDVPARLAGGAIDVRTPGGSTTLAAVTTANAHGGVALPADVDWVEPAALRPAAVTLAPLEQAQPHGRASLGVQAPAGFMPAGFELRPPAVGIGRRTVLLPPVRLQRPANAREFAPFRSNEEQARLADEAARCRRETPTRACENIVEFGDRSFALAHPALHWEGRCHPIRTGAESRLNISLAMRPGSADRWRFEGNAVRLIDGGQATNLVFPRFALDFADRIALDAPLHAAPRPGAGVTRLTMAVELPADVSGFELHLPPLRLGAQRIEIAPLAFERRAFGGGVEPFNC